MIKNSKHFFGIVSSEPITENFKYPKLHISNMLNKSNTLKQVKGGTKKMKNKNIKKIEKARLTAILIISLLVIITGILFAYNSFKNQEITGGTIGIIITIT